MKPYEKFLHENEKIAVYLFSSRSKAKLGKNIVDMKIFGSKVRGDYRRDSDIDILILVKHRNFRVRNEIIEIASELNMEFDCLIAPVIYTEDELVQNRHCNTLFAQNLAAEGISL